MSSLQSLRELISERLAAAAEDICGLCEGTIVQYEQELCRQRRLLDICWKPQIQLDQIVLPQHWSTEEDLCNQQRNFRVDQENPEPPQTPEELQDPEPSLMKEEPGELCISQDDEQLHLKQETETLMEIPTYEENEISAADLNNQQSFNGTDSQDEELSQHEESTSTTEEETDPQNRDQRKRRDRSHVQSVDNSLMSESLCDSDVKENFKKATWVEKCKQSPREKRLSSVKSGKRKENSHNVSVHTRTESDGRPYVCNDCDKSFSFLSHLKTHMLTHTGEKPFSCKECDKRFSRLSSLQVHIENHKECDKNVSHASGLETHMRTHSGEKPFSCKECDKSFSQRSHLKSHMRTHTGEKPFCCKECDKSFSGLFNFKRHMRTHTGEKPFCCKECGRCFSDQSNFKAHMRTHTREKPFSCQECDRTFCYLASLKKHKKSHRK